MSKQIVKKQKLIQPKELTEKNGSTSVSIGLIGADPHVGAKHIKHPKTFLENKVRPGREKEGKNNVPTLFDRLSEEQQELVSQPGIIFNDLKLEPKEEKLLHSLLVLLSGTDYKGNREPERKRGLLPGGGRELYPVIVVTPYELVAAYTGGKAYSGKAYQTVQKTLLGLQTKLFALSIITRKEGKISKDQLTLASLISQVDYITEDDKKAIQITVNPFVVYNIQDYFLSRPIDFYQQLAEASLPAKKVLPTTTHLADYLGLKASHKSARGKKTVAAAEKLESLYGKLQLLKYIERREEKRARGYLEEALEACKKAGALSSYKIKAGATGELTCYFEINVKCPLW
jgi:hypothetical protein